MTPTVSAAPAPGRRARLRTLLAQRFAGSGVEELGLQWRFRIVVLAFALPFLVYVVLAASQQASLEKMHAREQAQSKATLLAARLEDHVEQIDRILATAAQSVSVKIDDPAAIDSLLQSMRSYVPKAIDNIAVWSLDGHNIAALDRRAGARNVNVVDRPYFVAALAKRDFAFQEPTVSRVTGAQIIPFARPVFDARNEVIGVISMSIRAEDLVRLVDANGMVSENSMVTVVDQSGIVVARSVDPTVWIGKPMPDTDRLAAAFERRNGTREDTGIDGERRLSGFAVVGQWPWIVIVGVPLERVIAPISERLLTNLGIGLAILLSAFLIAGRVAGWTIAPLVRLRDDTARFGQGDLTHRSAVVGGGEIATLAADFNRMAAAIEERDRALKASRIQLRAIADNIPEQITYVDRDERYRFVNAYCSNYQTETPEQMIGKTVREVRGEPLYTIIGPMLKQALRGEPNSGERSMMVDGQMTHVAVTYVPDFDADGRVAGVYAFAQDITQRKTAELARIESEKRLITITNNLPAMICYIDEDRRFRFANVVFERWFQRPLADVIGQPFDRLVTPQLFESFDYCFLRGMRGEKVDVELEVPTTNSTSRWVKCSFIPDFDDDTGKPRGIYGMIHNVTKAKVAEQRLIRLAQFDTLTGIANRHQFNETLAARLAAQAVDGRPLALMFLDIDHFKQVNDRYGHACGDLLLKEFAQRLGESVRTTDAVARLSGDEFVVLLEGLHSDEEPQFVARKIIAAVEKPFTLDNHVLRVTTSIGIAMRVRLDEDASVLMKRADEALYDAKHAGRNTFRLAS